MNLPALKHDHIMIKSLREENTRLREAIIAALSENDSASKDVILHACLGVNLSNEDHFIDMSLNRLTEAAEYLIRKHTSNAISSGAIRTELQKSINGE